MLLNGTLQKDKNNKWIVIEGDSYWHPHNDHNLWLLIHGKENMDMCFVLDENNNAILKACYPDTREYVQD
jgi:hypothetical protein